MFIYHIKMQKWNFVWKTSNGINLRTLVEVDVTSKYSNLNQTAKCVQVHNTMRFMLLPLLTHFKISAPVESVNAEENIENVSRYQQL